MNVVTNQLNAALYGGSSYQPLQTSASGAVSAAGQSSSLFSGASGVESVLNAAYTPTLNSSEASSIASQLDDVTLQSILTETNYSENMSLLTASSAASAYDSMLQTLGNYYAQSAPQTSVDV